MTKDKIVLAAISWWHMHRPIDYTLQQHIENPSINTATDPEKQLAIHVAGYIKKRIAGYIKKRKKNES